MGRRESVCGVIRYRGYSFLDAVLATGVCAEGWNSRATPRPSGRGARLASRAVEPRASLTIAILFSALEIGFATIMARMKTFLVAHGGWSAGWSWKKMHPLMTAAGHRLITPTYTGLGEREHLASPSNDLE